MTAWEKYGKEPNIVLKSRANETTIRTEDEGEKDRRNATLR